MLRWNGYIGVILNRATCEIIKADLCNIYIYRHIILL